MPCSSAIPHSIVSILEGARVLLMLRIAAKRVPASLTLQKSSHEYSIAACHPSLSAKHCVQLSRVPTLSVGEWAYAKRFAPRGCAARTAGLIANVAAKPEGKQGSSCEDVKLQLLLPG
eukprot:1104029-Amphidinium_carterae.1